MTVSKNHNSNKMSTETTIVQYNDPAYSELVNHITNLWTEAKADAITSVNAHLLDANWKTGQYIVEFEQKGQARAEYGKASRKSIKGLDNKMRSWVQPIEFNLYAQTLPRFSKT